MKAKTPQKPAAAKTSVRKDRAPARKIDLPLIGLIIAIIAVSLIRLRLLSVPFERDEGEYAYMGQLMLHGLMPYKYLYTMKLPGTGMMYTVLMALFGQSVKGIHFGLLLINAGSMLLLYFALKRWFSGITAFMASALYGLMATSIWVYGNAAHATHFINFFAFLGIYFLSRLDDKRQWLWVGLSGLAFGLAFFMKQQAMFYLVFGGLAVILLSRGKPLPRILATAALYSFLALLPYLILLLAVSLSGAWQTFWFWTIQYAREYSQYGTFMEGFRTNFYSTFPPIFKEHSLSYVLAGLGLIALFAGKYTWKQRLFALGFMLTCIAVIIPGYNYRQHYFISLIPAVGLLAGVCTEYFCRLIDRLSNSRLGHALAYMLFALVLLLTLSGDTDYYLNQKPRTICKMTFGANPFVEAQELSKYLKQNTSDTDRIAVLGSEPEIFFYTGRRSATGYVYTYGLMEIQPYNKKMQLEMIAEMEKAKPRYLVFCKVNFSWVRRPDSPPAIFDWFSKYVGEHYDLDGIADNIGELNNTYVFGEEAKRYQPQAQEYVLLLKRKS